MTEWITTPDGIRIAYHQVGAGDPAIIFIHGSLIGPSSWDKAWGDR